MTELISGVNLPACQLLVAMGIPLFCIGDIRRLYGEDPKEVTPIDFTKAQLRETKRHGTTFLYVSTLLLLPSFCFNF